MDKPKILICDDEENLRESLNLILEDDYSLNFVTNGLEAVDCLTQNDVDLVILDIKMPKLNGLEALKRIKELKPEVKVIMITGWGVDEMIQQALNLGADHYIVKPFESSLVKKTVKEVLGIKK